MPKKIAAEECAEPCADKFLERLRAEIMHHKDKRTTFILQKMGFITALFGAAALQLTDSAGSQIAMLSWILYLVPFIAISYDIYIYAEDYKVKRAGTFIRIHPGAKACAGRCERDWEAYVHNRHREPLATYATMVLTIMMTIAAFLVIWSMSGNIPLGAWLLLAFGLLIPALLYLFYKRALIARLEKL